MCLYSHSPCVSITKGSSRTSRDTHLFIYLRSASVFLGDPVSLLQVICKCPVVQLKFAPSKVFDWFPDSALQLFLTRG